MDPLTTSEPRVIKNGKSIIGTIGAYQEKFGGSEIEIRQLPYIYFVIKMLDVPTPDYSAGNTKKDTKNKKQKLGFGTPIKDLPKNVQNEIRK